MAPKAKPKDKGKAEKAKKGKAPGKAKGKTKGKAKPPERSGTIPEELYEQMRNRAEKAETRAEKAETAEKVARASLRWIQNNPTHAMSLMDMVNHMEELPIHELKIIITRLFETHDRASPSGSDEKPS